MWWSLEAFAQALCVEGGCPSTLSFQVSGVTPDGSFGIVEGEGLGAARIAGGPCRVASGLAAPTRLDRDRVDHHGRAVRFLTPTVSCEAGYVQLVDTTTCAVSDPVPLSGGACGLASWGVLPGSFLDFDVADSGYLVEVHEDGAAMRATCLDPDGVAVASDVWLGQVGTDTLAAVVVSDVSERALVVWRSLYHGSAEKLRYAYLDETCTAVVTDQVIVENAYVEFFDLALDDAGSGVVALNNVETNLYWIDADGDISGPQIAFDLGDEFGVHVALDRNGTAGIVAAQIHSGDGIYYRRFSGRGRFSDPGPVWVEDVSYHYWYDGFTTGMNDDGAFVISWRSSDRAIEALLFNPDGTDAGFFWALTPDFSGVKADFPFDTYRMRHSEVPVRGANFLIAEVYDTVSGSGRKMRYYEIAPDGSEVSQSATFQSLPEGTTLRIDGDGDTYIRDAAGLYELGPFP